MAYLLPVNRYDDIRRAVDPTLEDEAIPDEVISSPVYLGEAERWARGLDVLAATRSGDEQEALYMGIIYYTAALISPMIPQSKQANMAGHAVTFTYGETVEARTARLIGMAHSQLSIYLSILLLADVTDAPLFVTTVSGRRA